MLITGRAGDAKAYVRSVSKKEVNDIYELRKTLEGFAIRLAAKRIEDADVAALDDLLEAAGACLASGDMAGYAARDRDFHERIAELSDNKALQEALARLSLQTQACRVFANQSPDLATRTANERGDILGALKRRDARAAERAMVKHIGDVQRSILQRL